MSTLPSLPPISSLASLPPSTHAALLTTLFESSPALHTLTTPLTSPPAPYSSYNSLISAIRSLLSSLADSDDAGDISTLDTILCAHPRLGASRVHHGAQGGERADGAEGDGAKGGEVLSALSAREQAAINTTDEGNNEEIEKEKDELARLNTLYEATFPGLRYVVFVNGRGRGEIMEDMRRRIGRGDVGMERGEGIKAMCDIALDRVEKLQRLGEE